MAISKRKLIYPIFTVLVLLGLMVIAVFYVQLKDLDSLRDLIAQEIQSETQRDVHISSAQLDFSEGVGVLLGELTLKGSSEQQSDFTCKKVLVILDWLPLLEGKINIQKLIFEGLMVQVTRDDRGEFNFGDLSLVGKSRSGATLPDLIGAGLMHSVSVRKSELWLVDYQVASGSQPLITRINNLSLSLNKHVGKSSLRVHGDGDIPFAPEKSGRIKLDGQIRIPQDKSNLSRVVVEGALQIRDVGTEPFQPYLSKVFAQHPGEHLVTLDTQLAGTLDGHIQLSGSLKHNTQAIHAKPGIHKEFPPVQGVLDFNFIFNQDSVEFRQLDYRAGDFLLMIDGNFKKFLSDEAWLAVTLKSAPFPVEKSAEYLPLKVFSREIHDRLHRFIETGNVEIAALNIQGPQTVFKGRSNAQIEAYDSGSVILHQVNLGTDALALKGVTGTVELNNGVVNVKVRNAHYEHIAITGLTGTVTHPFTDPWVTGTLEVEGTLAPLATLIREKWTLPDRLAFLKDLKHIEGTSHGKILVQGPLNEMNKLKWSGNVSLQQAGFVARELPAPVRNMSGNILFTRMAETAAGSTNKRKPKTVSHLQFENFKGEFENHYFTDVKADVFTKNGIPVKKVHGKIQLGVLQARKMISDPVDDPIMSFLRHVVFESGEIDFDYQNTGSALNKGGSQNRGSLSIKKLFIKHTRGFRPLKNLNATVSFDDHNMILKTARGWYGDSPLKLDGQFKNYSGNDPTLVLTAFSKAFLRQDFAGIPFLETLQYQGPAKVRLKFQFTDRLMELEKEVDLTQASYRYKNFLIKPENVSNSIHIFATLNPKGKIEFKKVGFELEGTRINGKGFVKSMDDPQFSIELGSEQFKTWPASQYILPLQGSMGGDAHFHISAQGDFRNLEQAVLQGNVGLKGIEYKPDSLQVPIKFNADMEFKNKHFKIQNGKLEAKGSKVFFNGIYQGGVAPYVNLNLMGPGIDLNQMVSKEGKPSSGFLAWLGDTRVFSKGSGDIEIKLNRFTHEFWTLPEISGKFTFKDQILQTENLTLGQPEIDQLMIKGRLSLADTTNPAFETWLVSRQVPIEKLFGLFGGMFHASLTGQTHSLKAHLYGQGGDLKQITRNLKGRVSFNLKEGRINTGRLLNGVIELFGIPADPRKSAERSRQNNKGYMQIFGDFSVVNGVARTEKFLFEEKGQRMSLVGVFDLNDREMETVVGVAPFRRVGRVIEKIPILGPIVTGGEEGSLLTTYYKVRGPFSGPKVESVPLTSVSKKVLGTFQGIFSAPSELFSNKKPEE